MYPNRSGHLLIDLRLSCLLGEYPIVFEDEVLLRVDNIYSYLTIKSLAIAMCDRVSLIWWFPSHLLIFSNSNISISAVALKFCWSYSIFSIYKTIHRNDYCVQQATWWRCATVGGVTFLAPYYINVAFELTCINISFLQHVRF